MCSWAMNSVEVKRVLEFFTWYYEVGVRGIRKPQNRLEKQSKQQNRNEIYQNTTIFWVKICQDTSFQVQITRKWAHLFGRNLTESALRF